MSRYFLFAVIILAMIPTGVVMPGLWFAPLVLLGFPPLVSEWRFRAHVRKMIRVSTATPRNT